MNKNKRVFQQTTIVLTIFIVLTLTSCNLNLLKNHDQHFINQSKFKKIIIPKGINIPNEDEEYKIPYTEEDLKKEKIDIFPPI